MTTPDWKALGLREPLAVGDPPWFCWVAHASPRRGLTIEDDGTFGVLGHRLGELARYPTIEAAAEHLRKLGCGLEASNGP